MGDFLYLLTRIDGTLNYFLKSGREFIICGGFNVNYLTESSTTTL